MSMKRGNASGAMVLGSSLTISSPNPKIPVFYGEDAYLWVIQVEKYFHANPMSDRDKLRVATAALEGPAFDWYQDWKKYTETALTWSSFKDALVQFFQPETATNPYGVLLNLRQTGTVAEYRELFETLAQSELLRNLSADQISRAVFVNGLSDGLREELELVKADSLLDLMQKAQLIEERNRAEEDEPGLKASPLMKFWGEIAGRKVVILLGTAAENSQIAKGVVKELGLPVSETDARFEFGDGRAVKAEGLCRGVVIKVQDVEIKHDFFVFDMLVGEDLLLGCDWIRSTGKLTLSGDLTMEFKVGRKKITVKGDPSLTAPDEFRTSFMRRVK